MMRFAGHHTQMNPGDMPYVTTRMAGELPKHNPDLVERITEAIIPGSRIVKQGGEQ